MLFQYMGRVVTFREKIDKRKSDALNPGENPRVKRYPVSPHHLCERFGVNKRKDIWQAVEIKWHFPTKWFLLIQILVIDQPPIAAL